MIPVMIRIPTSWLGADGIRKEAFRVRLSESVSRLSHEKLLQWWEAKDSTLRKHDIRALGIAKKEFLEISVPAAGYRHLGTVGAEILRSIEDLLVAMAGTLEESFATWEKVEAARHSGPASIDGTGAVLTVEPRRDPLLPGDKVVFLDREISGELETQFTSSPWRGYWENQGAGKELKRGPLVQSVRAVSVHPATGEQVVHLVGCYGVALENNQEPGFPVRLLRKISEARGITPVKPDDIIQVSVEVTPRIVRQLKSFALFPQVESQHEWDDEDKLATVCRRWVNRWHQSKCIRDASATVRAEIEEERAVTLEVPMSAIGWQNLYAVCKRLEITPEAWLQGVLNNLAHRCQKMRAAHECFLRNAHKRER